MAAETQQTPFLDELDVDKAVGTFKKFLQMSGLQNEIDVVNESGRFDLEHEFNVSASATKVSGPSAEQLTEWVRAATHGILSSAQIDFTEILANEASNCLFHYNIQDQIGLGRVLQESCYKDSDELCLLFVVKDISTQQIHYVDYSRASVDASTLEAKVMRYFQAGPRAHKSDPDESSTIPEGPPNRHLCGGHVIDKATYFQRLHQGPRIMGKNATKCDILNAAAATASHSDDSSTFDEDM